MGRIDQIRRLPRTDRRPRSASAGVSRIGGTATPAGRSRTTSMSSMATTTTNTPMPMNAPRQPTAAATTARGVVPARVPAVPMARTIADSCVNDRGGKKRASTTRTPMNTGAQPIPMRT